MSLLDKNKIFFGLIHYILSEQKNVDWILKTSLIDVTGVSSLLEEKAYNKDSLLDDIIDYITDIKPYHVQFSKYFEHYQTAREYIKLADKDWIETKITSRFDNISSTPDINSYFYTTVQDINDEKYNTDDFNTIGMVVFSTLDNSFYERTTKYNDDLNEENYCWVKSNISLESGIYYCEKSKLFYKFNGKTLVLFTDDDKQDFINSTKANRLFYLGIHDLDELNKELNTNFKGVEMNGSVFDTERFGYDIFEYSSTDYDSPTIVYDYMIIDTNEDFIDFASGKTFPYEKKYVDSTNSVFDIPLSFLPTSYQTLKVYTKNDLNTKYIEVKDFNTSSDASTFTIDFFKNIGKKTYYIFIFDSETFDVVSCFIVCGNPFIENNSTEYKRQFVVYNKDGTMTFKSPSTFIESGKVAIQHIDSFGRRKPLKNYSVQNDSIVIDSSFLKPLEHVVMTSFDYKYLYDKIYTWEDKYGRSNNVVNMDGDNFLRSRYENNRPSELVVSYPQNNLFVYDISEDGKYNIFHNDWKNAMCQCSYENNCYPIISDIEYYDDNMTIKSIKVDDMTSMPDAPGVVLINSELIEYNHIDNKTKKISALRRGVNGTIVYSELLDNFSPKKHTHKIGDSIFPFMGSYKTHIEKNNKYVSYMIKNPSQLSYFCPTGVRKASDIIVSKLSKINLLEDVYYNSTDIKINSCNVVNAQTQQKLLNETSTKKYTGDFFLKIDNDVIPFKSINRDRFDNNLYHITDFTLPKKYQNSKKIIYDKDTSFVHGSIPTEETNFTLHHVKGSLELDIDKTNSLEWFVSINDSKETLSMVMKNNPDGTIGGLVYNDGHLYGQVIDNILYKNDGSIYAKIEDDKLILIDTIITLENKPNKYESILINVVN